MAFFLDSDVCIGALRDRHGTIRQRFESVAPSQIKVPSMVVGELLVGAAKSADAERSQRIVLAFLRPFEVLPFDDAAARVYGDIRADLEARGARIGANDLIIAATTLASGGTLVTGNVQEFERVPGLRIQDWSGSRDEA